MEAVDYQKKLQSIREKINNSSSPTSDIAPADVEDGLYCCVLLAEENNRHQYGSWVNSALAKEFLGYAAMLNNSVESLDSIQIAAERMADTIFDRPRLKAELIRFRLGVLRQMSPKTDKLLSTIKTCEEKLLQITTNIGYADNNEFDKIVQKGWLKYDPVEWSARWEEVIDQAEEIAYKNLSDHPRGMGFCHALWHEKRRVLCEQFGVKWRSPAMMNRGVLFD